VNDDTLVEVTVSRNRDEIVYRVDCASDLTSEELEYYLKEVIEGICKWRPDVCKEALKEKLGKEKQRNSYKDQLGNKPLCFSEYLNINFQPKIHNH
jgi:hypothetical protein